MEKPKPKTRGPTEKELREFVSWVAAYGENIPMDKIDFDRLGRLAQGFKEGAEFILTLLLKVVESRDEK